MTNYRRLSDETYHPPAPIERDPDTGDLTMYDPHDPGNHLSAAEIRNERETAQNLHDLPILKEIRGYLKLQYPRLDSSFSNEVDDWLEKLDAQIDYIETMFGED